MLLLHTPMNVPTYPSTTTSQLSTTNRGVSQAVLLPKHAWPQALRPLPLSIRASNVSFLYGVGKIQTRGAKRPRTAKRTEQKKTYRTPPPHLNHFAGDLGKMRHNCRRDFAARARPSRDAGLVGRPALPDERPVVSAPTLHVVCSRARVTSVLSPRVSTQVGFPSGGFAVM